MMNGNLQQQPQQQTFDGATPVELKFNLSQCQLLLQLLWDMSAPAKTTIPLIREIEKQVQETLQRTPSIEAQAASRLGA